MKKKILLVLAVAVASMSFLACNDNEIKDGIQKYQWENVSYASQAIGNTNYYTVPQEGGTYTFISKNYDVPQVSSVFNYTKIGEEPTLDTNTKVTTNGKTVTVTITPNNSSTRYIDVNLESLVAYGGFHFVQEGAK